MSKRSTKQSKVSITWMQNVQLVWIIQMVPVNPVAQGFQQRLLVVADGNFILVDDSFKWSTTINKMSESKKIINLNDIFKNNS